MNNIPGFVDATIKVIERGVYVMYCPQNNGGIVLWLEPFEKGGGYRMGSGQIFRSNKPLDAESDLNVFFELYPSLKRA